MSRGVAGSAPSPIEKYGWSGVLIPSSFAVAATFGLAGQLEKTGRWEEAMGLWQGVLPLLSDDAPANRVRVLEGLGTAAAGMAQYRDAARVLGEAVALSRTVTGVGSPDYGRLVVAWSAALMRSGEPDKAEDAIRLLSRRVTSSTNADRRDEIDASHVDHDIAPGAGERRHRHLGASGGHQLRWQHAARARRRRVGGRCPRPS